MCQKLVVMAVATDCEECNKKALVCLSETSATNGPQGTVSQKTQKRDGQTVYERDRR